MQCELSMTATVPGWMAAETIDIDSEGYAVAHKDTGRKG